MQVEVQLSARCSPKSGSILVPSVKGGACEEAA
jgi:hypothetical protein